MYTSFQYGDVLRAKRCDGGARRKNVATDLRPLLRNCRSWYRLIDLQSQNIELKRYACETIARQTVLASSSSSSSASKTGEAEKKNKKTRSGGATWLWRTAISLSRSVVPSKGFTKPNSRCGHGALCVTCARRRSALAPSARLNESSVKTRPARSAIALMGGRWTTTRGQANERVCRCRDQDGALQCNGCRDHPLRVSLTGMSLLDYVLNFAVTWTYKWLS